MADDPHNTHRSYESPPLRRDDLAADPITQFTAWHEAWLASDPYEPAAMTVSTVNPDGWPSSRYVLCRGVDERGFVFYTNQTSRKAEDLASNSHAALCFGWLEQARQVRVEGRARPVDGAESDAYWATRPRGSQLGAWASDQSEVIETRADLERQFAEAEARFAGIEVPRPAQWGGYRVEPECVEFWQGRPDRVHDRFRYTRDELDPTIWQLDRLAP